MSLTNKVPQKDVQKTFNNIADNYDKLNSIMSLGTHQNWRKIATAKICLKLMPCGSFAMPSLTER